MGTHPIFESDFDCLTDCVYRMAPWAKIIEEKYYIPEEWMYGQIIGKQGKTLKIIQDKANLRHVYMDINNGYCLLVGDTGSMKKGKEIINDLLNLDPPSSSATSASAQSKNHRKSPPSKTESASKTRTLKGKFPVITKKLPPLPAEPKPVGQVSRFSLLLAGNDPDSEESEQEVSKRPMKKTQPPKLPHTQIVHVPPPLPAPQPVPSTTTKTKNSKKSKKKKKSERT